jgi:hypothetical protein
MPTETERMREMSKAFWAGREIPCPKHAGAKMTGSFVHTTAADHIFLTCLRGKETIIIQQRPKQISFNQQQVEGMVENTQRGDLNLCYRCQSKLEVDTKENATTGVTNYTFTCVRCFSYGTWRGHPDAAKIGSSPTAGTRKKSSSASVE